jgi:hypothetical protein
MPLYSHVIRALDALGLAYLHVIEPRSSGAGRAEVNHQNVPSAMQLFRPQWRGVLISAGGLTAPQPRPRSRRDTRMRGSRHLSPQGRGRSRSTAEASGEGTLHTLVLADRPAPHPDRIWRCDPASPLRGEVT